MGPSQLLGRPAHHLAPRGDGTSRDERYVLAEVCQMLLRVAERAGVGRALALDEAALTEMDIAERDARLPLAAQVRLGKAIISRLPNVNLALFVAGAVTPGALGVFGQVIANCATLGASLEAFARFHRLLSNGIALELTRDGANAHILLRVAPELEELRHPVEAVFASWVSLGRTLTGVGWKPKSVRFRHAPVGPASEHERFFDAPVSFEQDENELVLEASALAIPIARARPDRHALFTAHAAAILAELGEDRATTRRVSEHVARTLAAGPVQQVDVARALGMSVRTLSRRLRDEGTSFGEVLEHVRRDLAMVYLRDPDRAVYEVAFLLGYGEPSTFHRAFRKWTGHTPSELRRSAATRG